jgi:hypothetical protein
LVCAVGGTMHVLDVSDPTAPVELAQSINGHPSPDTTILMDGPLVYGVAGENPSGVLLYLAAIPGDFDADLSITEADLDAFTNCLLGQAQPTCIAADMNEDGVIDCADWPLFAAAFQASSGYAPEVPTMCDEPICPADITDSGKTSEPDGTINVFDLLELLSNWGTDGTGAAIAEPTNVVDVFDLLELLQAWGECE